MLKLLPFHINPLDAVAANIKDCLSTENRLYIQASKAIG